MASDSSASSSPPSVDQSKGSSVSSGLREEYEDLLRYAVITPKLDKDVRGILKKATPPVSMATTPIDLGVEVTQLVMDEIEEDSESGSSSVESSIHEVTPLSKSHDTEVLSRDRHVKSHDTHAPLLHQTILQSSISSRQKPSAKEDAELSRLEEKLDSWCNDLKGNILVLKRLLYYRDNGICIGSDTTPSISNINRTKIFITETHIV
jgi:centrosomal protein POC5